MARYVTGIAARPRAFWWDQPVNPQLPHPQAIVSDPVDTGLLDADGRKIYRTPDPVGFVWPKQS